MNPFRFCWKLEEPACNFLVIFLLFACHALFLLSAESSECSRGFFVATSQVPVPLVVFLRRWQVKGAKCTRSDLIYIYRHRYLFRLFSVLEGLVKTKAGCHLHVFACSTFTLLLFFSYSRMFLQVCVANTVDCH